MNTIISSNCLSTNNIFFSFAINLCLHDLSFECRTDNILRTRCKSSGYYFLFLFSKRIHLINHIIKSIISFNRIVYYFFSMLLIFYPVVCALKSRIGLWLQPNSLKYLVRIPYSDRFQSAIAKQLNSYLFVTRNTRIDLSVC